MEVNMQSPTFLTRRLPSNHKRPRSPPSPLDRPSKRISLGVNNSVSLPLAHLQGMAPPMRARQCSEDWVVQTRGLRIECHPAVERHNLPPPIVEEKGQKVADDDSMTIDSGDSISTSAVTPSAPTNLLEYPTLSINLPSLKEQGTLYPPPASHILGLPQAGHAPLLLENHPAVLEAVHNGVEPPLMSPPVSQEDTNMQPLSPNLQTSSQMQGKRQRFTMGPRADCDKCRRGVKGHWAHFD